MSARWSLLLALGLCACATSPVPTESTTETPRLVWPQAPEPPRIEYLKSFSSAEDLDLKESFGKKMRDFFAGSDDRRMTRPYAVSVNKNMVVVADPGLAVVHLFNTSKKSYRRLDNAGDDYFTTPIGVAMGADKLFIADSELNAVFILDKRFKLINKLENFQRPTSLALDPVYQRLYVADTMAHEIKVFDQAGKQLFTIGRRGKHNAEFNFPSHLAFAGGQLLVNDTMNFRVQVFSAEGQHLKTFGKHGTGSGHFVQPKGVAIDSEGHVYVADALANQVQIFDSDGTFLLGFGSSGTGPGEFQMPTGIAILEDKIYVADSHNQRVQVFRYRNEAH